MDANHSETLGRRAVEDYGVRIMVYTGKLGFVFDIPHTTPNLLSVATVMTKICRHPPNKV